MAVERYGAKRSRTKKVRPRKSAKSVSAKSAKKTGAKKSVAKRRSRASITVKTSTTRKAVPIKKARVGKRAVLPPLPPPPVVSLKAARSPMRRASRVKALLRNKGPVKASPAVSGVAHCTEAALREKLRLAAPYVELWLSRGADEPADLPSPEAAFVRIWQWLTLETMLDDRRAIDGALIKTLFVEECGRL